MIRLRRSLSLSAVCMAATFLPVAALSGCAIGAASFPDASPNPGQTPLGTIQGSDYGGHAPLVGAHVYVLQPSVTTATGADAQHSTANAYSARATSLLTSSYTSGTGAGGATFTTAQNSSGTDLGIPTSWYYETTDSTGAFNISGDYTCTAGVPVYLYLYGGSPTYPSANNQFSISTITWSGSAQPYTVTMTLNTSTTQPLENFYVGELFGINNSNTPPTGSPFTSAGGSPLNGTIQTVIAGSGSTALSTTQFSFSYNNTLPAGVTIGTTYTETGTGQVTFEPANNPSVVNLAVLGNCPNNGTLAGTGAFSGSSSIKYVFVNEVSTVAAAYAFRPFTLTPTTTTGYQTDCTNTYNGTVYNWANATCIGTSSTNLVGLENAANLAAQLYDITGSNVSTTYAGEGHIARSMNTAGTGIVPQANLDTLGNIIAACVDSANGSSIVGSTGNYSTNGTYSGISAQCSTLFTAATSNAIPVGASGAGIQPYDTAMAAINIARHPAGPPYSYSSSGASTFMTNLYTLPTANPPFAPNLASTGAGQPNDFSIAIYYTAANNPGTQSGLALTTGSESVAVDQIGNAWFTTQPNKGSGAGYFFSLSPTGVASNIQYNSSYIYGYVTIDSGNSAWSGAEINGDSAVTYVHKTGTATSSTVYPNPYTYATGATNSSLVENYTTAAVADAVGNVYFGNNQTPGTSTDYIQTFAGAATTPTVTATESATIPSVATSGQGFSHGAMFFSVSGAQSAYFDYNASSGSGTPTVDVVSLSTTKGYTPTNGSGFPVTNSTSGCTAMVDPEQLATLRSGDVIVPDYHNGTGVVSGTGSALYYITGTNGTGTAGTATGPGGCTQIPESTFHAGLNYPFGSTVDGNDYIYVTNRGGSTISVFDAHNAGASSLVSVSPSTGIEPQYVSGGTLTNMLNQPLNIAATPSGTLWVSDYGNNTIVEIIGLATPTTTPLSVAATATPVSYLGGSIGYRP